MSINYLEVIEDLEAKRDQIDTAIEAIRGINGSNGDSPLKGVVPKRKYKKREKKSGRPADYPDEEEVPKKRSRRTREEIDAGVQPFIG